MMTRHRDSQQAQQRSSQQARAAGSSSLPIPSNHVLLSISSPGILALGVAEGFVPTDGMKSSRISLAMCPGGEKNDSENDPTKVWYAGVADVVQSLLTNSPLNEGKKALVKSLAGDYDVEATRAKLNGLIDNEPVLFLSFVR